MKEQIVYSEQIIRDGERLIISVVRRVYARQPKHYYVARLEWSDRYQSSLWRQHSRSRKKALRALSRACGRDVHYNQLTRPLHTQQCQLRIVA